MSSLTAPVSRPRRRLRVWLWALLAGDANLLGRETVSHVDRQGGALGGGFFASWALRTAEPRLIVIAVKAVPIKVPATPSFEVKSAATMAAMPEAIIV